MCVGETDGATPSLVPAGGAGGETSGSCQLQVPTVRAPTVYLGARASAWHRWGHGALAGLAWLGSAWQGKAKRGLLACLGWLVGWLRWLLALLCFALLFTCFLICFACLACLARLAGKHAFLACLLRLSWLALLVLQFCSLAFFGLLACLVGFAGALLALRPLFLSFGALVGAFPLAEPHGQSTVWPARPKPLPGSGAAGNKRGRSEESGLDHAGSIVLVNKSLFLCEAYFFCEQVLCMISDSYKKVRWNHGCDCS